MSNKYERINLVSNDKTVVNGRIQDPNLVDAWGIAREDCSMWIANDQSGLITHYGLDGSILPEVIQTSILPTGLLVNKSSGFVLNNLAASHLIDVTKEGLVEGYNSLVGPTGTFVMAQGSTGSVFTGVAQQEDELYIADFGVGAIATVDFDWTLNFPGLVFIDPFLPAKYVPFNVANVDGYLYVTYAYKAHNLDTDPVYAAGLGLVNVFDYDGNLIRRFATYGALNAPWGVIELDSQHIAIANRGDGVINVYNKFGVYRGTLNEYFMCGSSPVVIDGLYGLVRVHDNIYFSAGPRNGQNGQYGVLVKKHSRRCCN